MPYHVQTNGHFIPFSENPNCLHATLASDCPQFIKQMVPHVSFIQISTVPWFIVLPPVSLKSPSSHCSAGINIHRKCINHQFMYCHGINFSYHIIYSGKFLRGPIFAVFVDNCLTMKLSLQNKLNSTVHNGRECTPSQKLDPQNG